MDPMIGVLLAKAMDHAEDGALDRSADVLRRMAQAVRKRFQDADDEEGIKALERVAEAPDSTRCIDALTVLLDKRAMQDEAFRRELEGMVVQAREAGLHTGSITQVAVGDRNVQAAQLNNSSVTLTGIMPSDHSRAARSAG